MWDSAFMAGFKHAQEMLMISSFADMKLVMDRVAPYVVRK